MWAQCPNPPNTSTSRPRAHQCSHERPVRTPCHARRSIQSANVCSDSGLSSCVTQARLWIDPITSLGTSSAPRMSRLHDTTQTLCMASSSFQDGPYATGGKLPSQAETVFNGRDLAETILTQLPVTDAATKSVSDLDYLSELMAIQQSDGPIKVGFFGTRNMGVTHQKLVEILSYAYASTGNHIYTSGSIGTNAAVIKGALRANAPDKLTVILPQSLKRQPGESQELLQQVTNLVEMPENDDLTLLEASRICNQKIISHVQQIICFAFHDSRLLLETCHHAKDLRKIVTLFYLD